MLTHVVNVFRVMMRNLPADLFLFLWTVYLSSSPNTFPIRFLLWVSSPFVLIFCLFFSFTGSPPPSAALFLVTVLLWLFFMDKALQRKGQGASDPVEICLRFCGRHHDIFAYSLHLLSFLCFACLPLWIRVMVSPAKVPESMVIYDLIELCHII